MPPNPKQPRPKKSISHLREIRRLPCMVCGGQSVAHHLLRTGQHGMGRKSGDDFAVPLCNDHHTYLHAIGEPSFFDQYFHDEMFGIRLATALWIVRKRPGAMLATAMSAMNTGYKTRSRNDK